MKSEKVKMDKPIDFINAVTAIDNLDGRICKRSSDLLTQWGYQSLIKVFNDGRAREFWEELLQMFPDRFYDFNKGFVNQYGRKKKPSVNITREIKFTQPTLF